jgi:hypothetical protein
VLLPPAPLDLHFGWNGNPHAYAHVKTLWLLTSTAGHADARPGVGLLPYLYGLWSGERAGCFGARCSLCRLAATFGLWLLRRVPPASRVDDHPTRRRLVIPAR